MVKRIVLIILLLWSTCAYAQYEHEFFTGDIFGVTWEDGIGAVPIGWEWKLVRIDDGFILESNATDVREVYFQVYRAGLYVFHCKAWNFAKDGETIQYSEWATSLTSGMVDGVVQAWQIKIKLRSVGPLIFFDERYDAP